MFHLQLAFLLVVTMKFHIVNCLISHVNISFTIQADNVKLMADEYFHSQSTKSVRIVIIGLI